LNEQSTNGDAIQCIYSIGNHNKCRGANLYTNIRTEAFNTGAFTFGIHSVKNQNAIECAGECTIVHTQYNTDGLHLSIDIPKLRTTQGSRLTHTDFPTLPQSNSVRNGIPSLCYQMYQTQYLTQLALLYLTVYSSPCELPTLEFKGIWNTIRQGKCYPLCRPGCSA
jgi:hypothetical protein